MVALTGIEPDGSRFGSVQVGLSSCVFSRVGIRRWSETVPRTADVTAQSQRSRGSQGRGRGCGASGNLPTSRLQVPAIQSRPGPVARPEPDLLEGHARSYRLSDARRVSPYRSWQLPRGIWPQTRFALKCHLKFQSCDTEPSGSKPTLFSSRTAAILVGQQGGYDLIVTAFHS
jgi:hypothetical protein